jgi:hypothetical protein
MKNKKHWLGILVLVLVFGIFTTGCSTSPNYYNFGNVSEDNFALIQVTQIHEKEGNKWPFIDLVKINGQGDSNQWKTSASLFSSSPAYVRVTPGEHTFTITFIRSLAETFSGQTIFNREIPVSITYNVEAGKCYYFEFLTRLSGGTNPSLPTIATITIVESDLDKNGNFSMLSLLNAKEVAKKSESFNMTSEDAKFNLE